ncbi:hypothetical protein HCH52_11030 [Oscillospiraceae bacterium HV4-5-C5C]|nr:hypothetical protein [Oscillospiraceae bacterium HV4-5-C5C]
MTPEPSPTPEPTATPEPTQAPDQTYNGQFGYPGVIDASVRSRIVSLATEAASWGNGYTVGGTSTWSGLQAGYNTDCSGFVAAVINEALGLTPGNGFIRQTYWSYVAYQNYGAMYALSKDPDDMSTWQAGDILWINAINSDGSWDQSGSYASDFFNHMAIYLGGGMIAESTPPQSRVTSVYNYLYGSNFHVYAVMSPPSATLTN